MTKLTFLFSINQINIERWILHLHTSKDVIMDCSYSSPCSIWLSHDKVWIASNFRYSVENIPLYDSAEDEPTSKLQKSLDSTHFSQITDSRINFSINPNFGEDRKDMDSHVLTVRRQITIPIQDPTSGSVKTETSEEKNLFSRDPQNIFPQKNAMISRIKSNSACRNYQISARVVPKKRSKNFPNGKPKSLPLKQIDPKLIAQRFACEKAQDELLNYEVIVFKCYMELWALRGLCEICDHCFHLAS